MGEMKDRMLAGLPYRPDDPDLAAGAGSVVTRDLPSDVVAVGNPVRVVREL
ncbi:hypothetical protein [Blastococcus saxobsidens]|uniref:Maltose O-acetyltransferase n=1 Tax=Blastococcus saxobsidens (strain DD2) TaxID=1146883 RepID=H6RMH2_BLASD|nr:hypothetical protein [Blastococcus saxobsidens]CCG03807.1 protein of unknown function [Blastococcus saxobsidens DD2]